MIRVISRAAGAAAVMVLSAGVAFAAPLTFNFNSQGNSPQNGPLNFTSGAVTVGVKGAKVNGSGDVTSNALVASYTGSDGGIGVCSGSAAWFATGGCLFDEHTVDSDPAEMALFTFDKEVTLKSVTFSLWDGSDDFDFAFYDGDDFFPDIAVSGSGSTRTYTFGSTWTGQSFGIGASRSCFAIFCDEIHKDQFKVKSLVVDYEAPQPVPLPAAGLLLVAAMGGLGPLRARRG